MTLFGLFFLIFIIYLIWRMWPLIKAISKAKNMHAEAQQRYEEEQERRERERQTINPDQSSVEKLQEANLDLEGGEYVDYEEVDKA